MIPPSYEQRWYPEDGGGVRLVVPYDGGPFDSGIFHIEAGAWDHTTCDWCNTRIPAMTLCYVTKLDPYIALCENCYRTHIVNKVGLARALCCGESRNGAGWRRAPNRRKEGKGDVIISCHAKRKLLPQNFVTPFPFCTASVDQKDRGMSASTV